MYTPEQLHQLDLAGLPEPKTKEQLDEIMRLFHAAVNERTCFSYWEQLFIIDIQL